MADDAALTILLADDHALFRAGMRHVLRELQESVTILEAEDGARAVALARQAPRLDLVLLDLAMPQMDGFAGLAALRRLLPRVPVVILSGSDRAHDMRAALEAGANGYVPKSSPAPVVLGALRLVLAGGTYVPPAMVHPSAANPAGAAAGSEALTPRQAEVLKFLGEGKSNKEIARALALTEGTVKQHVSDILNALNVANRTQAALLAGKGRHRQEADDAASGDE